MENQSKIDKGHKFATGYLSVYNPKENFQLLIFAKSRTGSSTARLRVNHLPSKGSIELFNVNVTGDFNTLNNVPEFQNIGEQEAKLTFTYDNKSITCNLIPALDKPGNLIVTTDNNDFVGTGILITHSGWPCAVGGAVAVATVAVAAGGAYVLATGGKVKVKVKGYGVEAEVVLEGAPSNGGGDDNEEGEGTEGEGNK